MKELYEQAIQIIEQIKQLEKCMCVLDDDKQQGRLLLRTDGEVNCSYQYANVRRTKYIDFLRGELKCHQKRLKALESEIKMTIK